jgi:hypothetical protein
MLTFLNTMLLVLASVVRTAQCRNVRENVIGTALIREETYWKELLGVALIMLQFLYF